MSNNLKFKYKKLIDALKTSLERIQTEVDQEGYEENRKHLFKTYRPILFKILDEFTIEIEILASNFTKEDHKTYGEYLRKTIHPIVLKAPFNKRCFEKPLGYPGDYVMMEMIYSNSCDGDSVLAQLLNAHTLQLPFSNAVRERCAKIENELKETILKNPEASILSVGAGSARELRNFLKNIKACDAKFFLLDQDKNALAFAREKLNGYEGHIYYLNKSVFDSIGAKQTSKFDFIYSTGLFDYLPQKFARRFIRHLFNLLKKDGRLIVGNASFNPHRVWMEHGSEWYLIYRTDRELLNLAEGLSARRVDIKKEDYDIGQMFLFLTVEK